MPTRLLSRISRNARDRPFLFRGGPTSLSVSAPDSDTIVGSLGIPGRGPRNSSFFPREDNGLDCGGLGAGTWRYLRHSAAYFRPHIGHAFAIAAVYADARPLRADELRRAVDWTGGGDLRASGVRLAGALDARARCAGIRLCRNRLPDRDSGRLLSPAGAPFLIPSKHDRNRRVARRRTSRELLR